MRVLELFCGTKSFTKVAEARGHECRTLDNDPQFNPTYCIDIMDFEPSLLNGWHPDIIWASPPCQHFSVAAISRNWKRSGPLYVPISKGAIHAQALVKKAQSVIRELAPAYYFIENPRGMLRKMHFMRGWNRSTVTYCKYGARSQKPTDIWNNCLEWKPRPVCRLNGSKGTCKGHETYADWTWSKSTIRAVVPPELCLEILVACENGMGTSAVHDIANTVQVTEVTQVTKSLSGGGR